MPGSSFRIAFVVYAAASFIGNVAAQTTLFWTDAGAGPNVHRVGRDGSNPQTLFPPNSLVYSIYGPWLSSLAVDSSIGKVYWTEQYASATLGRIERSDFDGSNRETVLPIGSYAPSDIVLDPGQQQIYWNSLQLGIQRMNYDGTGQQTIANASACAANGMAADLSQNWIFWVESCGTSLMRAHLDGSNPTTIVASPGTYPYDVAVDPVDRRIYWCNLEGTIKSSWYDGTDVQTVLSGLNVPTALSIDATERKVYWAGGGLWRADLNGSDVEFIYAFGPSLAIALDNASIAPPLPAAHPIPLLCCAVVLAGLARSALRRRRS